MPQPRSESDIGAERHPTELPVISPAGRQPNAGRAAWVPGAGAGSWRYDPDAMGVGQPHRRPKAESGPAAPFDGTGAQLANVGSGVQAGLAAEITRHAVFGHAAADRGLGYWAWRRQQGNAGHGRVYRFAAVLPSRDATAPWCARMMRAARPAPTGDCAAYASGRAGIMLDDVCLLSAWLATETEIGESTPEATYATLPGCSALISHVLYLITPQPPRVYLPLPPPLPLLLYEASDMKR